MENESMPTRMSVAEKTLTKESLLLSGSILLASLIVSGAILTLTPQGVGGVKTLPTGGNEQAVAPSDAIDVNVAAAIDDDAGLGDKKKAKVAIVEFTDFECPFCKRFHADTFDTIVKDYVDTGKAIIVTRDFPLSFHDPKATEEAALAECVRKEKGDAAYFAFGTSLYENTLTNGKGLPEGKQADLIARLGANVKSVTACAASSAVKEEIAADIADGSAAGVSGTPSFVIGVLQEDGSVVGERVVGALPTEGFKAKMEQYLSK